MCFGGSEISDQIGKVKHGVEIVVCTPGRFIDLLSLNQGRITNLLRTSIIILDEADRMFDMGFEPQILAIINNAHSDRQLLMFSATFPLQLEKIARQIMKDPLVIVAGGRNVVCNEIQQHVEVISEQEKWPRLLQLLQEWHLKGNILIFADTYVLYYSFCLKQILTQLF